VMAIVHKSSCTHGHEGVKEREYYGQELLHQDKFN
jgi:hypothetical protein